MTAQDWYLQEQQDATQEGAERYAAWEADVLARDPDEDDAAYAMQQRGRTDAFAYYRAETGLDAWLAQEHSDQPEMFPVA